MSRKGLILLIASGLAWGIPYFFIRIAVSQFDISTVVLARVVIGAAILLPIAVKQKAIMPALKKFKWVLAFALIEMAGPWFLITNGEKTLSSSLAGLLVATVPLWAVAVGYWFFGDKSLTHPKTLIGFGIGFLGVALLVGIDSFTEHLDIVAVIGILIATIGYAVAPAIAGRHLNDVPSSGVMTLAMASVAVIYAVPGIAGLVRVTSVTSVTSAKPPTLSGWISLLVLGVICSAVAFVIFFALIREIGSARATLTAYLNTGFAILLGVTFLNEPLTLGIIVGFPLVLVGSYFASKKYQG